MSQMQINGWFVAITLSMVILWKMGFFSTLLNMKSFSDKVPPEYSGVIDEEEFEISKDYVRARSVYGIGVSVVMTVLFFGFWWLGGFNWLDQYVRGFGFGPIISGVIYIGMIFMALQIVSLPLSIYSVFGIEAKFGFNKMTPGLFIADFCRSLLLSALVGVPMLMAILWVFNSVPMAWLWAWLITIAFMMGSIFLAPTLIMPLYNKFEPLEEGELKDEIFKMAEKCEFPVKEISIMDGSKRSTKSNAFFTGFGSTKRIVLFDTLVKNHTVPELVTVLAHEIGHFKKRHIVKRLVIATLSTGAMFFLLSLLLSSRSLYDAFGVKEMSVYVSLVLFMILLQPVNQLLGIAGNWMSRKHEFEADAYASDATDRPDALADALKKLSVDNKSHLTPHPFHVFLNYSHPPVTERIAALGVK